MLSKLKQVLSSNSIKKYNRKNPDKKLNNVTSKPDCARKVIKTFLNNNFYITIDIALLEVNKHCFKIETEEDIKIVTDVLTELGESGVIRYCDVCKKWFPTFV